MPIAPMHEHDYVRVAQPFPPTDKHVLVLLTAFEMFGTRVWLDEVELADVLGATVDEVLALAEDLAIRGWVTRAIGYYIHEDQADLINKHYPSALDN